MDVEVAKWVQVWTVSVRNKTERIRGNYQQYSFSMTSSKFPSEEEILKQVSSCKIPLTSPEVISVVLVQEGWYPLEKSQEKEK